MEGVACEPLVQALHPPRASRLDDRPGQKTRYASTAAALGAVAVCLPPSPSGGAEPRTMPPAQGQSHAASLVGMGDRPWEHPLRTWRDPVAPAPPAGAPVAAQRWVERQAGRSPPVTRGGEARAGQHPCGTRLCDHGCHCRVVWTPEAHHTREAWMAT